MNLSRRLVILALSCLATFALHAAIPGRENPVPVRTVAPEYPSGMRGTSGLVMVKCTIDNQGNVTETAVTKTSNEAFDKYAVDAIKKWKFKPARQDGNPITVQVTIPIKFVADQT